MSQFEYPQKAAPMNFKTRLVEYKSVLANESRADRSAYEATLIAEAASGDGVAFRVISDAHYPRIFRVARRIVRTQEDAADVAQDVLIILHRKLDSFRGECELGSWLHRVSVNAALMFLRRNSRHRGHFGDDVMAAIPSSLELHQVTEDREQLRILQKAWEELSTQHREALDLRVVHDESLETIADRLDISMSAAKSRIHRARIVLHALAGAV